jgi:hypothetical protein
LTLKSGPIERMDKVWAKINAKINVKGKTLGKPETSLRQAA